MNVLIIKKSDEILSVNMTSTGCAMELYALECESIEGKEASRETLEEALQSSSSVSGATREGDELRIERHFVAN